MDSILLVCLGNICRSPLAEAMLQQEFPEKNISSAGLTALVDHPADPFAQRVAAEHGLDLSQHRARQITDEMCHEAELILVMESWHKKELETLYLSSRGRIFCLGQQGEQQHDIADPYGHGYEAFRVAYEAIAEGVNYWSTLLKRLN